MKINKFLVLAFSLPFFFSACENSSEREIPSGSEPQVEVRSDEKEMKKENAEEVAEEIANEKNGQEPENIPSEEFPAKEMPKLQELGAFRESDGKITFGVWPQSIKDESVIIDENCINTEIKGNEFYLGDDGNWYARCQENAFDVGMDEGTHKRYYYSNGMPACKKESERILFFKVEPIEWVRLGESDILIADKALTGNIAFYDDLSSKRVEDGNPVYSCNYSESRLRSFVNGNTYKNENENDCSFFEQSFISRAFTEEMQKDILESLVKNDGDSTADFSGTQEKAIGIGEYINAVCRDTLDKVFVLSLQEVTNPEYGFLGMSESDPKRIKKATDYAIANYAALGDKGTTWFTRSPYWKQKENSSGSIIYSVNSTGKILVSKKVTDNTICVVPAIRKKISKI